jgi:hypothetical protein
MKRLIKKLPLFIGIVIFLTLLASGFAGCVTKTVTVSPGTTNAGSIALIIVKGTQTKTLTMADIEALPDISDSTGDITSSGTIEGPSQYKGVALTDILKAVGGITADEGVRISAKDGYSMTFSYNQIVKGTEFPTYDSTTGKEVPPAATITVFMDYEKDGQPLDDSVGPLRLGIMAPGQVTDGHWWVKWAQKIEVIALQRSWTLNDVGTITENISKSDFEAGCAPGCHGVSWTDAQGHVWSGEPLWLLAAYVTPTDPSNPMGQFNTAVWNQGFEVEVIASNGSLVTYSSSDINNNNNIIVANQEDGQPLSSTQFPLALQGSGIDLQHQISTISSIKVILPTTTTMP